MVSEHTHIHHNGTRSMIDLVFVSDPHLVRSCSTVPPLSNSDHLGLQVDLSLRSTIITPKSHVVWRYKHADWERACDLINSTDWKSLLNQSDMNKSWCNWRDKFMQIMHETIPSGTIPPRRNRPWLTKKLIQAIRKRNALHKRAKATNNYTKYRHYRNKVVGLLKNAKMAYFRKLNPRKSKEFWKACNLLNRRTTTSIPTLKLSNSTTMAHTDLEKAELFSFHVLINLTLHWMMLTLMQYLALESHAVQYSVTMPLYVVF